VRRLSPHSLDPVLNLLGTFRQADRIGRLELSTAGLKKRNALVYRLVSGLQSAPRLVVTLGGGYPRNLEPSSPPFHQVVQSHMDVYRQCAAAHARL